MCTDPHEFVVVIRDDRGHVRPFRPACDKSSAEALAARLRQWTIDATVKRGRVEHGEFVAASVL
jgi:hypothetical protein